MVDFGLLVKGLEWEVGFEVGLGLVYGNFRVWLYFFVKVFIVRIF